jgi:NADH:ubiquinone oxidoreductase subunit 2 (subunit N)
MVLFNQTIQAGYIALVIVAVINSIISVGYYFKLIMAMYTKENLMKNRNSCCYLCGCRYCDCIEYRFGFVSIFSFGLIGIKF